MTSTVGLHVDEHLTGRWGRLRLPEATDTHHAGLRNLGNRLLGILYGYLVSHSTCDENTA
jgi:hypothetical protein